jgi:hypothetical protein
MLLPDQRIAGRFEERVEVAALEWAKLDLLPSQPRLEVKVRHGTRHV